MVDDKHGAADVQATLPVFLTSRDIQEQLQIGERLTYKLLSSGAIPSVRVNGLYRVRREDLDEALESGAVLEVRR